jgi:hypothetical protein
MKHGGMSEGVGRLQLHSVLHPLRLNLKPNLTRTTKLRTLEIGDPPIHTKTTLLHNRSQLLHPLEVIRSVCHGRMDSILRPLKAVTKGRPEQQVMLPTFDLRAEERQPHLKRPSHLLHSSSNIRVRQRWNPTASILGRQKTFHLPKARKE